MRVSKNRQSGFIKKCKSVNNFARQDRQFGGEQFSAFDDEFSSFHYKYPEESENEFSLFVLRNQSIIKGSRDMRKSYQKNHVKGQNVNKVSRKEIENNGQMESSGVDEQEDVCYRETQKHFSNKNRFFNKQVGDNYYSATTNNSRKANKVSANKQQAQYAKYYMGQQMGNMNQENYYSHNGYRKQVGKLTKRSKDNLKSQYQINPIKQQQQYQQTYYQSKQLSSKPLSPRIKLNSMQKVKSQKNIFFHKKNPTQFVNQYALFPNKYQQAFQNINKSKNNVTKTTQNYFPIYYNRRYNEVSQSSVVQSEPSFLKDRVEEVQRRKRQLQYQKKQLQSLKQQRIQENLLIQKVKYFENKELEHLNKERTEDKQFETENSKKQYESEEDSLDEQEPSSSSSLSDSESSQQQSFSNRQSQQTKNQNYQYQHLNHHKLINQDSSSQQIYQKRIYDQPLMLNKHFNPIQQQIPLVQQNKRIPNIPKSPRNNQHASNVISLNIQATPQYQKINQLRKPAKKTQKKTTSIEVKSSPLKIIKQIQKRAQKLRLQQQKQAYQKQGISVKKGGLTFQIDAKQFVFEKPQDQQQSVHNQNQTIQSRNKTLLSAGSNNSRSIKTSKNINSKQELRRRRELAKSYDKYARSKVFGPQ